MSWHGREGERAVLQRLTLSPADGGYGYQYNIFNTDGEPRPPDLTVLEPGVIEGYLRANTRPFGPNSVMPPFGRLLSEEERLAISEYIGAPSQ